METNRFRCDVCDIRIQGSSGHCRSHKFAIRRAGARIRKESLIVDYVGKGWWIWDSKGEVLVIGQDSKVKAYAMLDLGILDYEDATQETVEALDSTKEKS